MKKGKRSEYGQKTKVRNHGKRLNEHISVRALKKEYNADRSKDLSLVKRLWTVWRRSI